MFLSRLYINIGDDPNRPRPGRQWLRNFYRVHQRLCMAFPSENRKTNDPDFLQPFNPQDFGDKQVHVERRDESGFLFRIDPTVRGEAIILVQSALKPNWQYAFHNADYFLAAEPETKKYNPAFTQDQRLQFRLFANPTRKIDTKSGPDGRRRHGKRVPVSSDQLDNWLVSRAQAGGFEVDNESLVIQPGYSYINKECKGQGKRLRSARYDGILKVLDPEQLRETLVSGIGPAKAFGFGLLSVAPVPGSTV